MVVLNIENLIGFAISTLVGLILSYRLLSIYFKGKEKTVGYFAGFIFFRFLMFVGFLLTPLIFLLSGNLVLSSLALSFAFLMVFFSLVFPALLFTSFKLQGMKKFYFGLMVLLGIVGVFFMITGFSPAQYIPTLDITVAVLPQFAATIYALAKIIGVLPLSILFLSQARSSDRRIRVRSLLIGLGLFWVVSTLFVPQYIAAMAPLYFVGIYACIGDILIFSGVRYRVS